MPAAQQYICDLTPYQPGLPIELVARTYGIAPDDVVKLASNENPLGASPKGLAALAKASQEAHRYPEQHALLKGLSKHLSVDARSLIVGNGSNDVLDLVARTYLRQGDEAITSQYAFAMYGIAVQSVGATNIVVPANEYGHDLQAMLHAITPATKVIWIANPNNPTGTFIPYEHIQNFLDAVPSDVAVVLDEAYYEYLGPTDRIDATAWLAEHPNLILVRTFSKIYGLAGLRVGYGIASHEVAELLNRVRLPFNTSGLAIAAATAALKDKDFVTTSFDANTKGRQQILAGLRQLNLRCLPAYGNFVTFEVAQASKVNERLLEQGVIVRPLGPYDMASWLRVTIGSTAENQRFLEALHGSLIS